MKIRIFISSVFENYMIDIFSVVMVRRIFSLKIMYIM